MNPSIYPGSAKPRLAKYEAERAAAQKAEAERVAWVAENVKAAPAKNGPVIKNKRYQPSYEAGQAARKKAEAERVAWVAENTLGAKAKAKLGRV